MLGSILSLAALANGGRTAAAGLLIGVLAVCLVASPAAAQEAAAPPAADESPAKPVEPAGDPLDVEAAELQAEMAKLRTERLALEAKTKTATGEDLVVLRDQIFEKRLASYEAARKTAENLAKQEADGRDVSALRGTLQKKLLAGWPTYQRELERRIAHAGELRKERDEAKGDDLANLESDLTDEEAKLQATYRALQQALELFDAVGLDAGAPTAFVSEQLATRAEQLAGRVALARKQQIALAARAERSPDDAAVQAKLQLFETRLERATANLSATVALMGKLDLETAEYRQLLLETTGEITTDILDAKVLMGLAGRWRERAAEQLAEQGPGWFVKALVFGLILMGFRVLSGIVRRIVGRAVKTSRVQFSRLLQDTLISWSARLVMVFGFMVALAQLGFQIGPLLAGLGIAGFVLGFALQDSLSNFAAGAMILIYRPFDVGDVIEAAGVAGKVNTMSLVCTTILTFDNQTLIVPNTKIWGDVIRNVTAQSLRRVDLVFGIGYADDIPQAESVLREIVAKHEKVLEDPAPVIKLHTLGESSVDFIVRPWARTEDYWDVYWDLTREVKMRFDREGISIPFPQRDVHVYEEKTAAA